MPVITWNEMLDVGIKCIDDQHKKLIRVINDYDEVLKKNKGIWVQRALFHELASYFTMHFDTEEEYMLNYN